MLGQLYLRNSNYCIIFVCLIYYSVSFCIENFCTVFYIIFVKNMCRNSHTPLYLQMFFIKRKINHIFLWKSCGTYFWPKNIKVLYDFCSDGRNFSVPHRFDLYLDWLAFSANLSWSNEFCVPPESGGYYIPMYCILIRARSLNSTERAWVTYRFSRTNCLGVCCVYFASSIFCV